MRKLERERERGGGGALLHYRNSTALIVQTPPATDAVTGSIDTFAGGER